MLVQGTSNLFVTRVYADAVVIKTVAESDATSDAQQLETKRRVRQMQLKNKRGVVQRELEAGLRAVQRGLKTDWCYMTLLW